MKKQNKRIGALIGVEGLVFAKLTADATDGATYATEIIQVPGIQEIGISAEVSEDVLPADNNPTWEVISSLDSIDATLTMGALGKDTEVYLLGKRMDANGALLTGGKDEAPWVAMGFRAARSDGSEDYVWMFKGKFRQGDENYRTKEKGTVNWQTPELVGTFGQRDSDKEIMVRINTKDEAAAAIKDTFFDTVYTIVPGTP